MEHIIETDQRQNWSKRVIKYIQQARDLEAETVLVGMSTRCRADSSNLLAKCWGKYL